MWNVSILHKAVYYMFFHNNFGYGIHLHFCLCAQPTRKKNKVVGIYKSPGKFNQVPWAIVGNCNAIIYYQEKKSIVDVIVRPLMQIS